MIRAAALAAVLLSVAPLSAQAQPSPWGASDTLGALNHLSPEGVRKAVGLVKTGKVYSLAIPTSADAPAYGDRKYAVEISPPPGRPTPPAAANKVTAHDEKVTTSMGIGTQMDGFGHLGIDHTYYNGLKGEDLNKPGGFTKLDFADRPPIVTRGVLIDMARHFGKPRLEAGQAFGRKDVEAAMKAQGVKVGKGDVVLFHTGWMQMLKTDKALYSRSEPGVSEDAAAWLADQGVVAIGADTIALEPLPPVDPQRPFVVHQLLLAKRGVHVLENIRTDELVADRAKEFLIVLAQPRFAGTVQVVVNPVAIR